MRYLGSVCAIEFMIKPAAKVLLFLHNANKSAIISHFFADTTLVRVSKLRFNRKYSGVLRSPHRLEICGGPVKIRSADAQRRRSDPPTSTSTWSSSCSRSLRPSEP